MKENREASTTPLFPWELLSGFAANGWKTQQCAVMGRPCLITANADVAFDALVVQRKAFQKSERVNNYLALGAGPSTFSMEGQRWKQRRKKLQASFSNTQLKYYYKHLKTLHRQTENDLSHRQNANISRIASDFVSRGLANLLLYKEGKEPLPAVQELIEFVGHEHERSLRFARFLNRMTSRLIETVKTFKGEDLNSKARFILKPLVAVAQKRGYDEQSVQEVVDELRGLAIAGHETTSETAANFWWHIGKDKELQRELVAESSRAECVLPDTDESHPLLSACFREVLRLHSPVPLLVREAVEETTFDHRSISPGDLVAVSIYCLHRNPTYWQQPDIFDATRFTKPYVKRAHIPFGIGQRECLGDRFAMVELCMHAIGVLSKWQVETIEEKTPSFCVGANLRRVEPVLVRLSARHP